MREERVQVTPVTDESVRREPQGFWRGTRYSNYLASLGDGTVYREDTVWNMFLFVTGARRDT